MEQPQLKKPGIKLTPGNRTQKGRRSAPKAEDRVIAKGKDPIAYHFSDPRVGGFDVLNSDNGWWVEADHQGRVKLQKLVDAYCFYMTDDEATSYSGITLGQLRYFQELHPAFFSIKHAAKTQPDMHAKKTIVGKLQTDPSWAAWWLERTQKDTFSTRQEQTGANGRDLFDGMTEDYKKLTEDLENEYSDEEEEHTGGAASGDTDAEPGGDGHEATLADGTETKEKATA